MLNKLNGNCQPTYPTLLIDKENDIVWYKLGILCYKCSRIEFDFDRLLPNSLPEPTKVDWVGLGLKFVFHVKPQPYGEWS
jgi:hypothetical protein